MIVVFLQRTLKKEITNLSDYTLLLHIPPLALTDRWNDGQRNKLILVGLGNLRFLQVNILCSSCVHLPLFILLFGKLASASFPNSKEAGRHKKQIAMTSNRYAQQPMECSTGKE
jgi:hypothetical protein